MKVKILGDSPGFWQWDTGQKLVVEDDGMCNEVHFCNTLSTEAMVLSIKEQDGLRVVDVPNILLQQASMLMAYLYRYDTDGSETCCVYRFSVIPRPKPANYVYTETEVQNYSSLAARMDALEEQNPEVTPEIMTEVVDVDFQLGDVTTSGYDDTVTHRMRSEPISFNGYDYVDIQLVDDSFRFAAYSVNNETGEIVKRNFGDFIYHGTQRFDDPAYSLVIRVASEGGELTVENVKNALIITRGNFNKQYPEDAIESVCKGENVYFPCEEPLYEQTFGTSGYKGDRDNAVTRPISIGYFDGIRFTFTDPGYYYKLYSISEDGTIKTINSAIEAPTEYVFTDKGLKYVLVVDKMGSSDNYTQEDMDIIPGTHTIEYFYANTLKEENTAVYGYSRQYTDITHTLNWENKTVVNEFDQEATASNEAVMAALPAGVSVEIKKNAPEGRFRVLIDDPMGWTIGKDYTEYAHRDFPGVYSDGERYQTYVEVSHVKSSDLDKWDVLKYIRVYTFNDVGVLHTKNNSSLYGKTIAVIGDSIVQGRFCKDGTSVNLAMAKPWSHYIAEACNVEPANFGIGGAKVVDGEWRSLYRTCEKVIGYDVCFVCAGTNDYGGNVSAEDFRAAYDHVLSILVEANSNVVVCTPVYRTNKTAANSAGLTLADYCNIMKELAAEKNCQVLDLYTMTNTAAFKATLTDGLHPNEVGQKMIADIVLDNY